MKPQTQQVYRYLCRHGKLTALDALHKLGCFRLAARIHDLKREGLEITTTEVPAKGHSFAKYSLAQ